jgi:hypothetical protein
LGSKVASHKSALCNLIPIRWLVGFSGGWVESKRCLNAGSSAISIGCAVVAITNNIEALRTDI